MSRKKQGNLLASILATALVFGGCSALYNSVFGDQSERPTAGPLPSLTGKTLIDAKNVIENLGADLTARGIGNSFYCGNWAKCTVRRTKPGAGSVVSEGTKVTVMFVTAEQRAFYRKHRKMPRVVGWSESRARKFFMPINAVTDMGWQESSKVPEDRSLVIRQSPKAGKPLRMGQSVELVIGYNFGTTSSKGDADVDVNMPNRNRGESRFCRGRWWC